MQRALVVLALGILISSTLGCATTSASRASDDRTATHSSGGDEEITRQIRLAVRSDPTLSSMARTVTVITLGSVVMLRGNVASSRESETIARHARSIAGVSRIDNALSVRSGPRD